MTAKMPIASAAQLIPSSGMSQSGVSAGSVVPGITGNTAGLNSFFGSLLSSYTQTLNAAEQEGAAANNNALAGNMLAGAKLPSNMPAQELTLAPAPAKAQAGHQGSEPKTETAKKTAKTDSSNVLTANVTSLGAAAMTPVPAMSGASSLPAQTTNSQPAQTPAKSDTTPNPVLSASNLAFAVRVAPANSNAASVQPLRENNQTTTVASDSDPGVRTLLSGASMPAVSAIQQREPGSSSSNKDSQEFANGEQQQPLTATQSHAAGSTSTAAARPNFDTELQNATAAPRQAHIQVVGNDNQRVDIRLLEHGGTLAVSVRSSDVTLTRTLQDHMPELTARLESEHLHSETWTPATSSGGAMRDPGNSNSFSGQSNSSGGSGQQQQQRDGEKPKWLQELESNDGKTSIKETFYVSSE